MEKSRSFPAGRSWAVQSGLDVGERSNSYSFNGPSGGGGGGGGDPELKRKRRVAAYDVFTTERRIKSQVKNSFKWIKTKLSGLRYGI